jgi:DNA end-binding protein Ku
MSLRHSWKGFLKLSLVTIPVKAYPAAVSGGDIHLNQLHADCKSRIQYKKICPVHGDITSQDIVSGFEYAKGQFVLVDTDELDKLRTESDKAIQIDAFISPGCLDPLYSSGKTYYLVPDGPLAQKSYAVFWRGMRDEKRQAVAQVVMHGKKHVVWLRPLDDLIVMTQLSYHAQVTKPAELAEQAPKGDIVPEELDLLRTLMAACTPKVFDYAKYQDQYTLKLTQLIDAKVAGKEIVAAPAVAEAQVLNFMEALKQSVAQKQQAAGAANGQAAPAAPKASKPKAPRGKKAAV